MAPNFSKLEKKVEELYNNNISINTISNILKKPKSSIYNAIARMKRKKTSFNKTSLNLNKTKSGPIKKVQNREKRVINRELAKFPKIKNKELLSLNDLNISERTLQRFLKEENYHYNTSFKKPYLSKKAKKERNLYAKKQLKNIKNINFYKIIFSDESAIERGHGSRQEYYRKKRNCKLGEGLVSNRNRGT